MNPMARNRIKHNWPKKQNIIIYWFIPIFNLLVVLLTNREQAVLKFHYINHFDKVVHLIQYILIVLQLISLLYINSFCRHSSPPLLQSLSRISHVNLNINQPSALPIVIVPLSATSSNAAPPRAAFVPSPIQVPEGRNWVKKTEEKL